MADTIELLIEDRRWEDVDLASLANQSFAAVFAERGLKAGVFEIGVLACDDAKISELNAEFRGKGQPTNVLSWPTFDLSPEHAGADPVAPHLSGTFPDSALGDIAISFNTCAREAADAGIPLNHHVCHLLIHSCLHLLGFDHQTDTDAARMEGIETKLLASMGIEDPY